MNKETLDKLWSEVKHVGNVDRVTYDGMLVLGSVFGRMRTVIEDQKKQIETLKKGGNMFGITGADYAIANSNGISNELAYSRVYKGMSIEQAITKPVIDKRGKGLWTLWKDKSEVGRAAFYNNLKNGLPPEEAIKKIKGKKVIV